MPLRIAAVGFRHGHILSFIARARELDYCELVGVVEESDDSSLLERAGVERTHATFDELLAALRRDKKNRGATLRFVVLNGLAEPARLEGPDEQLLRDAYAALL